MVMKSLLARRLALRAGSTCLALAAGLLVATTRLERDGIPGLSIAIVKHGQVSLVRAYGEAASARPMRIDTPIVAASLMKSITAACVMQLVDAAIDFADRRALDGGALQRSGVFSSGFRAGHDRHPGGLGGGGDGRSGGSSGLVAPVVPCGAHGVRH